MARLKIEKRLKQKLRKLDEKGLLKGKEMVVVGIKPAQGKRGPRYVLRGFPGIAFLRMNSNSYLGLSLNPGVIKAEETATEKFGVGPGAVRFISGTNSHHLALEEKLAEFHRREAAMIFSSAYSAIMGVMTPLIDSDTIVISDALNHNSIINAIRLSRPEAKEIYRHLDTGDLEAIIKRFVGKGSRVLIVSDGIFSMRGDHAPLDRIAEIADRYDTAYREGINILVDDSHGVGAFGKTGRGTEEFTRAQGIDMIVATLGKSLGVNGGYITASAVIIDYLRETAPFYIYSNPITPAEAAAAVKALEILDSRKGRDLLGKMRRLTKKFEAGLLAMEYEIIESEHPIVPLMVRDTRKTAEMVRYLIENGILATGLNYPVVPRGDEEIRFQVSADHTEYDIGYVLEILNKFKTKSE
jgi:glycine C-acetyltransferase